jgi:hypothetical protein
MPDQPSIHDQFSDEEKDHLSYLGSMLREEPSEEEEAQQRFIDAFERAREQSH